MEKVDGVHLTQEDREIQEDRHLEMSKLNRA